MKKTPNAVAVRADAITRRAREATIVHADASTTTSPLAPPGAPKDTAVRAGRTRGGHRSTLACAGEWLRSKDEGQAVWVTRTNRAQPRLGDRAAAAARACGEGEGG